MLQRAQVHFQYLSYVETYSTVVTVCVKKGQSKVSIQRDSVILMSTVYGRWELDLIIRGLMQMERHNQIIS